MINRFVIIMDKNKLPGTGLHAEENDQCFRFQSEPLDLCPGEGEIQDHKEHMELYYRFHKDSSLIKLRFTNRTKPEFHRAYLAGICPQPGKPHEWLPPFLCLWNGNCWERKIRFQISKDDEHSLPVSQTSEDIDQTINKFDYVDHGDEVKISIEHKLPFPDLKRAVSTVVGKIATVEKHCRHRKGDASQGSLKRCPCNGKFISAWRYEAGSGGVEWFKKNKPQNDEKHLVFKNLMEIKPRSRVA